MDKPFGIWELKALCSEDIIELVIPDGYTTIMSETFWLYKQLFDKDYTKSLVSVRLPETITQIEHGILQWTNVTEINFPSSLTHLDEYAFYETNLKKIDLTKCLGLTRIPKRCFVGCEFIEEVIIPDYVTEIGDGCFAVYAYKRGKNILKKVSIPVGLIHFGEHVFKNRDNFEIHIRLR